MSKWLKSGKETPQKLKVKLVLMYNLSRGTTFPTTEIVRTSKTQIKLRIREARPDFGEALSG